jgi:hypothetical protein
VTRQLPALRVALLGVATALAGFAVIAAFLGWHAQGYIAAQHRASAATAGKITEDGLGENGDIRVRWTPASGREHIQRFAIYDTERYQKGSTFAVAYDPAYPAVAGLPGDPEETSVLDDLQVPIGIAGVAAALLILTWVLRGALFRRAGRRPGQPVVAVALAGELVAGAPLSVGNSAWFGLSDPGEPFTPSRWQRVMWHPAVESADGPVNASVHGDLRSRRRVVVEMPDGTRMVPIGRLRHRLPKNILLDHWSDVRTDLRDSFILPAGTMAPPSQRWWRHGLVLGFVGAGIGVVMGFLIGGGGIAVLPFAAGACAVMVNSWALSGTGP